jgi:tRNA pseudouridine55 synthase
LSDLLDGVLLVDKPSGPTSHDVVSLARRVLGQRRVGHAGTLDPLASGLLPLVLGRATRLLRFLPHSPKTYVGVLRLGLETDTDDVTGEMISRHEGPLPDPAAVVEAASALLGSTSQIPPAFSARKVGGRRLYELARRGEARPAAAAPVTIHRFEVRPGRTPSDWEFTVDVSVGTYVRALVRDLGKALGCGATLAVLRRTAIGPWRVEEAVTLPAPRADERGRVMARILRLQNLPLTLPTVAVADPETARRWASGVVIEAPSGTPESGLCCVRVDGGPLLGVAESSNGLLHPRVVLWDQAALS